MNVGASPFIVSGGNFMPEADDKVFEARLEKLKKDVLKGFDKYIQQYFNDAHETGETPTEDDAVKQIFENGNPIFESNDIYKYLTVDQQKKAKEACHQDIETKARAGYRTFVDKYHPQINGGYPYHVTEDQKKELRPYIRNIEAHMITELNEFLGDCAKHSVCPNEKQITACFESWMTKYRKEYGPSFKLMGSMDSWLHHQLESYFPEMMKTYHAYADSVKITDSYPADYVGVTVSAPPHPKDSQTNTPEGAASSGKGEEQRPPVTDSAPKEVPKDYGPKASLYTHTNVSFSGCDMVVSANMKTTEGHVVSAVLGSVQTVSYSIYRKLSPILNIGNVNAKDYVGGPRTIAGSLVFTVFNQHWASELMDEFMEAEGYAAAKKILMDEVAPIDLTISMANEYGVNSRLAIYGVRLFSEGQVMSINDIYTENTYQYVALNIDYLANINAVSDLWASSTERDVDEGFINGSDPILGIKGINQGDNSRTSSKAPETPGESSGTINSEPSSATGETSEQNPIVAKSIMQDRQEVRPDQKVDDDEEKIKSRIGVEPTSETSKATEDELPATIDGMNGKAIAIRNRTKEACIKELTAQYASLVDEARADKDEGRINQEGYSKRMAVLKAEFGAIKKKIEQAFDGR